MMNQINIAISNHHTRRALLSVTDKDGILPFARALSDMDWEIVATQGTATFLQTHDIPAGAVEDMLGFSQCLGHRLKTLDVRVLGGLLWDKADPQHNQDAEMLGLIRFDLLVESFYPFEKALHGLSTDEPIIEYIDVGGPTMLRAAAKNHASVIPVVEKPDYEVVIEALKKGQGDPSAVPLALRRALAGRAFKHLRTYDEPIQRFLETPL